jgi:glutamate racemase
MEYSQDEIFSLNLLKVLLLSNREIEKRFQYCRGEVLMLTLGLFDSGFGGLTVAREVVRQMPYANIEYFGDSGRAPYGERSQDEILRFSRQIIDFLGNKGVDLVIIACNTATAAALDQVVSKYSFPIVGVIEPGAKAALDITRNKHIGVIATKFTTENGAYPRAIKKIDSEAAVISQACPLFCPLVEAGKANSPELETVAAEYLSVYKNTDIDTLVLGCTHYPLLVDSIERNLPSGVELVDPAVATVKKSIALLAEKVTNTRQNKPNYRFYTSGDPVRFQALGSQFFGRPTGPIEKVVLN